MKRVVLFFVALTALATLSSCGERAQKQPTVEKTYKIMTVESADRTLKTGYSATINGCQTVEIRPQVSGMITEILINEGDFVSKGQVLFVIDQTPYKAAYEIAQANVKSAEASLATAQLILDSNKELFAQDVVSEFDLMTSRNDLAEAEARLALARAEEINATNNLSYTEVRSPVNGVASMIPYRVGALVSSNINMPLVTVSDDSEVYAYFSMAENTMLDMIQQYGSLREAMREMPDVELVMSNGQTYKHKGHIDAISGTISATTGAVSLRASFPNRQRLLRDGGSGQVVIPSVLKDAIVIPQAATYELQERIFVYKVVDGRAVSSQIKVMAQNNGVEYIVTEGLSVGDVIVAEGAGLVREGAVIKTAEQVAAEQAAAQQAAQALADSLSVVNE
ncbi:MAG: efflux RND transporter periplasmic adaptor subunit [Tidjanibacter sp.]|nr:efflux RND transporter periplasmic adaptor subunit [Tidjanibacter sp.]MBR3932170.1 efflux RND transporter periplasmic adaptor subunit [Tidjanibacter sp.]